MHRAFKRNRLIESSNLKKSDIVNGQMGAFQVVSPERIPEILDKISTHVQQNFVQINTLEGEVQISRYDVYTGEKAKSVFESKTDAVGDPPDRIARFRESTATFSCDMKKKLHYTKVSGKVHGVMLIW